MIIDGKAIATAVQEEVKAEIAKLVPISKRPPKLAVILVGGDSASRIYVRNKERACKKVGIDNELLLRPADISEEELLALITKLNQDTSVDGILVQLPLPKHIDENKIMRAVVPDKDVDGFHPENIAGLFLNQPAFIPCTPAGLMVMLETIGYHLDGKHVVVLGRSQIVGKPAALLALRQNATVTIAHSHTPNLSEITRQADVLIVSVGQAEMVRGMDIKEGAVVLDVGMDHRADGSLCGDVLFEEAVLKASWITPVPGGVGPVTVAMLMKNTLQAYRQHEVKRNESSL